LLEGEYPTNMNELVLVVNKRNQLNVNTLNAFGFEIDDEIAFDTLIGREFRVIPNDTYYANIDGQFIPKTDYETMYASDDAIAVRIVGILRVKVNSTSEILSTGIGYTTDLTDHVLELAKASEI